MRQQAYTLIEMLVVVVLLGMAAGVGVPALVKRAGSGGFSQSFALLRDSERAARLQAVGHGLILVLDRQGLRVVDQKIDRDVVLPVGAQVTWMDLTGESLSRLAIDGRGHSPDVVVQLAVGSDRHRYFLGGITGEWTEIPPETPTPKARAP